MKLISKQLQKTVEGLASVSLSDDRKALLTPLITYIQGKVDHGKTIRLNFICTHNSRRSHLSQIWAQALAGHFGLKNVFCYSGGTEATALFPKVAETLANHGFNVQTLSEGNNPIYAIKYAHNEQAVIGFSKTFDDPFNPRSVFAAIMTCSQADEGCPFIGGAEVRIPITFEDPKAFDHTPQQDQKYHERSLQIATELNYVFAQVRFSQ